MASGPTRHWVNIWDVPRSWSHHFWKQITGPRVFILSFAFMIAFGTLGFMFLPGLYVAERFTLIDAFFTATSAVCVTGLIVKNTATFLSFEGQLFLLLLIQMGGLGILTFTSAFILSLGKRLPFRLQSDRMQYLEVAPEVEFQKLAKHVLKFTLLVEGAGLFILFFCYLPYENAGNALWHALFHSISAFCNAGFSTFSDSLIGYQSHKATLLVVMSLITFGGIGFLTWEEIYLWMKSLGKKRRYVLSLHSRMVLWVSLILIILPAFGFLFFEWRNALLGLSTLDQVLNSFFMSVTARTAGFNTVDYASLTESSNFLTIILMSIGGAPGSTAGGIKVTTFFVIGLMAYCRFRRDNHVHFLKRTIPDETIQRAMGLFVFAASILTLSIFIYSITEIGFFHHAASDPRILTIMFEASSAFNTVGLSLGITPKLTELGKILTIVLMFVGRVGPLVFASAIGLNAKERKTFMRYAQSDVVIG